MGQTDAAERPVGPGEVLRTALALLAILPGLALGIGVWLVTRDRRRAVNRTYALWGRLGPRAAGIELDVRGAEHLEAHRPAVFLINHQSGVDALLACALLRHDFAGVVKTELRRNPLLGPAMAFAGTVFLDRLDRARAVSQLAPAVEALRHGLSIAVAPEGTRSRDGELGRFRKGAFHLALAAGVPIVPIVIENSRDVLPPGALLMTRATVRVRVHPPVSTAGWTVENLDAHIAQVQRLYAESLGT